MPAIHLLYARTGGVHLFRSSFMGVKIKVKGLLLSTSERVTMGDTDLSGLLVGYGMNTAEGGTTSKDPWMAILYIDDRADNKQAEALEDIFGVNCHGIFKILKLKRAKMTFIKQAVGPMDNPCYTHTIKWEGIYHLETEPLRAMNGAQRTISGMADNGMVYVSKSVVNKYNDPDLPRSSWNAPGNSSGSFEFYLNPSELYIGP